MALPVDYDLVQVRGRYVYLNGTPVNGQIKFKGKVLAVSASSDTMIIPAELTANLDPDGQFAVSLPATNDPDIVPNGWTYTVEEKFPGGRTFEIDVPVSAKEAGVDLSKVAPAPPSAGDPTAFVTVTAFQTAQDNAEDAKTDAAQAKADAATAVTDAAQAMTDAATAVTDAAQAKADAATAVTDAAQAMTGAATAVTDAAQAKADAAVAVADAATAVTDADQAKADAAVAVADAATAKTDATDAKAVAADAVAAVGIERMPVSSGLSWTGAVDLTTLAATARTIRATLTGNVTFALPTPPADVSYTVTLLLTQDATGSRTLTLPAPVLSAYGVDPVLSTTSGVTDLVHLLWTGAQWIALLAAPAVS